MRLLFCCCTARSHDSREKKEQYLFEPSHNQKPARLQSLSLNIIRCAAARNCRDPRVNDRPHGWSFPFLHKSSECTACTSVLQEGQNRWVGVVLDGRVLRKTYGATTGVSIGEKAKHRVRTIQQIERLEDNQLRGLRD